MCVVQFHFEAICIVSMFTETAITTKQFFLSIAYELYAFNFIFLKLLLLSMWKKLINGLAHKQTRKF